MKHEALLLRPGMSSRRCSSSVLMAVLAGGLPQSFGPSPYFPLLTSISP